MKKILISTHHNDQESTYNNLIPGTEVRDYNMFPLVQNKCLPIILPSIEITTQHLDAITHDIDGVVIYGGYDVDPVYYGQDRTQAVTTYTRRDNTEIQLINYCIQHDIPLFGICRGLQIINVALGGTLIQDLPSRKKDNSLQHDTPLENRKELAHNISIAPESWLHHSLNKTTIRTNSFHHQSIDTLGEGLIAVAHSSDSIIEAINHRSARVRGVQWHPEFNYEKNQHSKSLFDDIINNFFVR